MPWDSDLLHKGVQTAAPSKVGGLVGDGFHSVGVDSDCTSAGARTHRSLPIERLNSLGNPLAAHPNSAESQPVRLHRRSCTVHRT
ncbi:MAG: hypothetical protein PVSMB4_02080 [Ktedonobacterales bacterium]